MRHYKAVLISSESKILPDAGGWSYAEFILSDGTKHRIKFEAGYYKGGEDEYYSTSIIPTLMPYDAEKVRRSASLALFADGHMAYNADGTELSSVFGLADLEFWRYDGDVNYKTKDCLYYIETELGTIYVCSDTVFMFKSGDDHEPQANELISGSLFELLGVK